ncbi:type II 3-dehydroquinate dehydratase [Vogesella sp. LIG4]|uniref:type II 3-dehydroquinate dehydratase n=1 Tax=Vogesella sp. LIG4 TaxID=1192162 RepID=UPI00081F873A|nr:type II 3-dehydroquinate dehydratase [Vogesella sp. LIG4]SCK08870.1 3-dehydroquinate dehydratase [Vogesella sp. LIG4]
MATDILVLNGPNLNLLGKRQPEIYGHATLSDVERGCTSVAREYGLSISFCQSNAEHQLIDWIHAAREQHRAIVINPGGYSHTSIALMDALAAFEGPVIEVHISNIHRRESFRQLSYVSKVASGVICGLGIHGYNLAVHHLAAQLGRQA